MDTANKFAEKRTHARVSLCLEYTLTINDQQYSGITGNVSQGGLYLLTVEPTLKEDALFKDGTVTVSLDSKAVTLPCSVTYVGTEQTEFPTGIGIAFAEEATEQRKEIQAFITSKI